MKNKRNIAFARKFLAGLGFDMTPTRDEVFGTILPSPSKARTRFARGSGRFLLANAVVRPASNIPGTRQRAALDKASLADQPGTSQWPAPHLRPNRWNLRHPQLAGRDLLKRAKKEIEASTHNPEIVMRFYEALSSLTLKLREHGDTPQAAREALCSNLSVEKLADVKATAFAITNLLRVLHSLNIPEQGHGRNPDYEQHAQAWAAILG